MQVISGQEISRVLYTPINNYTNGPSPAAIDMRISSALKNNWYCRLEGGFVRTQRTPPGSAPATGRLEVCGNGVWGRVCNRYGFWGPDNARVVCRQLGFSEDGNTYKPRDMIKFTSKMPKGAYVVEGKLEGVFGTSERAPLYGEVHCVGDEPEMLECSHSSIGRHSCGLGSNTVPDIVISCFGKNLRRRYIIYTSIKKEMKGDIGMVNYEK